MQYLIQLDGDISQLIANEIIRKTDRADLFDKALSISRGDQINITEEQLIVINIYLNGTGLSLFSN